MGKVNPKDLWTQSAWAKKEKLQKQLVNYRVKTKNLGVDGVSVVDVNGGQMIHDKRK